MNQIHQKILNAILQKAKNVCPDSLLLVGIYGSVVTGDLHERSDLDLLILVRDEAGYKLATGFILDDSEIGYDIYCMTFEHLQNDAACRHAYLARLMDAEIVYVNDESAYQELLALREKARAVLLSDERYASVAEILNQAKLCYANACLYDSLGSVRKEAFGVITYLADAAMIYHERYFQRGTKRMLEELAALPIDAEFLMNIESIAKAKDINELRALSRRLLQYAQTAFVPKKPLKAPSEELAGTYEEMFSNWRNKTHEAEKNQDCLSSFMNLCSLQLMLDAIADTTAIGKYDLIESYDPTDLSNNAKLYDACLNEYETVYQKAGLTVKRYHTVDAFVEDYLK